MATATAPAPETTATKAKNPYIQQKKERDAKSHRETVEDDLSERHRLEGFRPHHDLVEKLIHDVVDLLQHDLFQVGECMPYGPTHLKIYINAYFRDMTKQQ